MSSSLRRGTGPAVVAAAAVLMLAACGSSGGSGGGSAAATAAAPGTATASGSATAPTSAPPPTPVLNGAEKMTSAKLSTVAGAALRAATSVRLAGETKDTSGTVDLDLKFQGPDVTGFVEEGGMRIDVTRVGGATYIKAPKAFYASTDNAAAAELIGDRWVKATADQAKDFADITLDKLGTQFFGGAAPTSAVTRADLKGAKTVTITGTDGTTIWVADTGPIRPVQAAKTGTSGGLVTFTGYGTDFKIAAPAGAIDASKLG